MATSGGVMITKLDKLNFTSEFESHWMLIHLALCHMEAKHFENYGIYD